MSKLTLFTFLIVSTFFLLLTALTIWLVRLDLVAGIVAGVLLFTAAISGTLSWFKEWR